LVEVDQRARLDFALAIGSNTETITLLGSPPQARAAISNIFNHPNFGPPSNYPSSPLFGQTAQMLGTPFGSGGLNPLDRIGDRDRCNWL